MAGLRGSRSGLFFKVVGLLESTLPENRPEWLLIENVKHLVTSEGGGAFTTVLCELWRVGYDCEWQVINSRNHGVPQHRERVYIVGHLRGRPGRKILPISGTDGPALKQIIRGRQGQRVYDSDGGISITLSSGSGGFAGRTGIYTIVRDKAPDVVRTVGNVDPSGNGMNGNVHHAAGVSPTLTTNKGEGVKVAIPQTIQVQESTKKGYALAGIGDSINYAMPNSKTRRGRVGKGMAHTLDTACTQAVFNGLLLRKLTPRECFRLQGFSDELYEQAAKVCSDTQLYKQAGNAVTVTIVYEIGKKLMQQE